MATTLDSSEALDGFVMGHEAAAIYFSSPGCNVCHVLKPKIKTLFAEEYPRIAWAEVDCQAAPEAAAQQRVFTVPTLVVYFDGREAMRWARTFSVGVVSNELSRPYKLMFED